MPSSGFWKSKPPAGALLDLGHPLAQGLLGAYTFNEGGGALAQNLGTLSGRTGALGSTATRAGQRLAFDGASTGYVDFGGNFGEGVLGSPWSVVLIGVSMTTSQPGGDAIVFGRYDGSAKLFQLDYQNGGNIMRPAWGDGSFSAFNSAEAVPARPFLMTFTMSSANIGTLYFDNREQGSAGPSAAFTATTPYRLGMRGGDAAQPWIGQVGGLLWYTRALSPADLASLAADPYQMFAPPVWRRYFIPPAGGGGITGTGAITIGVPQLAGTGTFTTTGTGAITIGVPVVAGTGSFATTGSGAISIGVPVIAGTGSFAVTGTGAVVIAGPVLAATGSFATTGTGAISIGIPVLAGTGTVTGPPGSGDITIAPPVVAGSGSFATTGSGAIAISPPVVAAAGSFATTGSGAISIGGPAVAGSGSAVDPGTGSGAIGIAAPVLAASGTFTPQTITGTGAITVGGPQIAGTGSFATTGTGAVTVGKPAVAGTGTFTPFTATGTGTITIPAPVIAGTGTLIYTGTGTITIPGPLLSGYSVLATRAAASDSAYGGAVGSDAAYAGAGAGDLALVGATASDSEV